MNDFESRDDSHELGLMPPTLGSKQFIKGVERGANLS